MLLIDKSEFVLTQLLDLGNFLHVFEVYQNRMMGRSPFLSPLVNFYFADVIAKQ
jgi:hypothetical protein